MRIGLFCAVCALVGMLAGCGQSSRPTGSADVGASSSPAGAPEAEALKSSLDLMGGTQAVSDHGSVETISITLDRQAILNSVDDLRVRGLLASTADRQSVAEMPNPFAAGLCVQASAFAVLAAFKQRPIAKAEVSCAVAIADDYGHLVPHPFVSYSFDRASYDKVDWANFSLMNMQKVAQRFRYSKWLTAHFSDPT